MSAHRAEFVAAIGAPGSGKSLFIKQWLTARAPSRLLIWDPMNEYGAHAERVPALAALVDAAAVPAFRLRFVCSDNPRQRARQFDVVCYLAYQRGDVVLVADELGDVTSATLALVPAGWSAVCRKGRHRGLAVVGGVQRPALVDKNFFGFATLIHCGRLNYSADVRCMDDVLALPAPGVPPSVRGLAPLQWIERDMLTGSVTAGAIRPGSGPSGRRAIRAGRAPAAKKSGAPPL